MNLVTLEGKISKETEIIYLNLASFKDQLMSVINIILKRFCFHFKYLQNSAMPSPCNNNMKIKFDYNKANCTSNIISNERTIHN